MWVTISFGVLGISCDHLCRSVLAARSLLCLLVIFLQHETRHSRQLSSSALGPAPAPPIVMPKPVREVKRARSADNLLGDGGGGSAPNTPHRVPGGVQLVPVFPGRPPLKKSLSGNSLDPDTDGSHHQPAEVLMEQTDGTGSGKSSPSKPGLGSRPGSARGRRVTVM